MPLACAIPLPLQLRRQLKRASSMCCLLLLLLVLPWLLHVPAASTGSGTGCGWGHPHRGHTNSCTHLRENLPLPLGLPLPRSSWYVARTATVLRLLVAAGHERHSGGMEVSQRARQAGLSKSGAQPQLSQLYQRPVKNTVTNITVRLQLVCLIARPPQAGLWQQRWSLQSTSCSPTPAASWQAAESFGSYDNAVTRLDCCNSGNPHPFCCRCGWETCCCWDCCCLVVQRLRPGR